MKQWRLLPAVLAAMTLIMSLNSTTYADRYKTDLPCEWRQQGRWIGVAVDLLYWKPCSDGMDFAAIVTEEDGDIDVDYKHFCTDWEPGVRAQVRLPDLFYGWDLLISYTRLNVEESASQRFSDRDEDNGIVSPLLFTGDGFTGTWEKGEQELDLLYNEWNLLLAYDLYQDRCHRFAPYFGIAGMFVEQEVEGTFSREEVEAGQRVANAEWSSDYSGVGIRMGAHYEYRRSSCLAFFANAHATLLAGEAETSHEQVLSVTDQDDVTVTFNDEEACHFVPGYHIQAGMTYENCLCGWNYSFRLGYEFLSWHNLPRHRVFHGENNSSESGFSFPSRTRTLGYHGAFAGVSSSF